MNYSEESMRYDTLIEHLEEMKELYPLMDRVKKRYMVLESLIRMKMITNDISEIVSDGIKVTLIPAKPKTVIDMERLEEEDPDTYMDLLLEYQKDDHEISKLKIEVRKK